MRTISRLLAVVLLAACPVLGRAVTIRVQDPNFTYITGSPSFFMFMGCPGANDPGGPYMDNGSPISADGCFGGVNATQNTISSLTLTFQNTTAIQNSTAPDAAFSDIFSSATFTPPANLQDTSAFYTFTFSGGALTERQAFVITEDGVPFADFPTVTLQFTPEPSSFMLLGTSLVGLGSLYRRYRRA